MAVNETALISAGVQAGLLEPESVSGLKLQARRERISLLEAVTRAGRFPTAALYQALADLRGVTFLQPRELKPDQETIKLLPRNLVGRKALPVKGNNGEYLLVMPDPDDHISLSAAARATGKTFVPALADPGAIDAVFNRLSRESLPGGQQLETAGETDSVSLFDDIMKEVYLRRASDVHFEPFDGGMRIRLRVDGHMQEYNRSLNPSEEEALITRIKVLSALDIAEQRMAQDGALKYRIEKWNIPEMDIRIATIPTRWGERATMRILGQETGELSLEELGMPEKILQGFRRAIAQSYGMILVTGPTGSGKSTTLYAGLRELDIDNQNILTVEDPVEQTIDGISQVQVSGKVKFAQALRSFLRHDPDVILVGEIRDKETVEIGLRAAMTGHLVLSTLHTNDAVGAVTRLMDIGAERFLIGSTLIGVVAQRLVRRLCINCREKRAATAEELILLGISEKTSIDLFEPKGCSFCLGTGFRGRIGMFEALWIGKDMGAVIADGAGEQEIRTRATELRTLWQDACQKVLRGDVCLSEVMHLQTD
jgi:type II secretory ATPase GspE/PulE/Tfp pilus assembly ATPase PilB-like protein